MSKLTMKTSVLDKRCSNLQNDNLAIEESNFSAEKVLLQGNSLNNIDFLESFTSAVEVNASNNKVAQTCSFAKLNALTLLDLSHNQLTSVPDLVGTKLQTLNLSHNQLTLLDNVTSLKSLVTVDVSFNRIAKLGDHFAQNNVC